MPLKSFGALILCPLWPWSLTSKLSVISPTLPVLDCEKKMISDILEGDCHTKSTSQEGAVADNACYRLLPSEEEEESWLLIIIVHIGWSGQQEKGAL